MERIKALIDTLHLQKERGFTPAQLLPTVQLLQSELLQAQKKNGFSGSTKVAVTMPAQMHFTPEFQEQAPQQSAKEEPIRISGEKPANVREEPEVFTVPEPPKEHAYFLPKPILKEEPPKIETSNSVVTPSGYYTGFSAMEEAPTLIQHQPAREIHEMIKESKEELNDRLKQQKTELAHTLKETPIKDLRKGIGINDRFTFVSELFRGDDAMYERSIKTINGFNILSEAEYWINRELKFKLGWNDSKEVVQHFYHLVRRRFA